MPGCILHVSGEDFQVDAFLANSNLRPYRVHHRGEIGHRSCPLIDSGLSLDVSSADGNSIKVQIVDAIAFLSTYAAELERLHDFPGVTSMLLDFGYYRRDVAAQIEYLPPELLLRAGTLGIGIKLSLYAVSDL
ncbi:MAG: hypothetical protein ABL974_08115 [Prosthecobacter sp.]